MSWAIRTSAHGLHMVYGQQAINSCGIACVMMVNFKMKKLNLAGALSSAPAGLAAAPGIAFSIADAVKIEKQVYGAYKKVTGQDYDGTAYTFAGPLAQILSNLGIGTWVAETYPQAALADKVMRYVNGRNAAPVIILVAWRTNGAHFVVCDTVVRSGATVTGDICDPGGGEVHTVPLISGAPIVYQAGEGGSIGDANGWIIHRTGT